MKRLEDLTKIQFMNLKDSGLLCEIYPEAPESYDEIIREGETKSLVTAFDENLDIVELNIGDEYHIVCGDNFAYHGLGIYNSDSWFSSNSIICTTKKAVEKYIEYFQPTITKNDVAMFIEKELRGTWDKNFAEQLKEYFEL